MFMEAALMVQAFGPGTRRLNVLFFAVDDLRYQLGTAGPGDAGPGCTLKEGAGCSKMVTPALDALAADSLFLDKNYVQQAICAVSRTSILTGRRPDSTQVWDLHSYWRDLGHNYTTIPEHFKNHGYESIGMGKIFHPGSSSGTDSAAANASLARNSSACPPNRCGPCSDDQLFSWSRPFFHSPNQEGNPAGGYGDPGGKAWSAVNAEDAKNLSDAQIAQHAVDTLQQLKQTNLDKPFFLAVGFHRPHLPFIVPQAKLDLYPLDEIQLPAYQTPPVGMPQIAWSNSGELVAYSDVKLLRNGSAFSPGDVLPPQKVKELRRGYYAAVSHMDDQIGIVMASLKETGYADNTIVSFWGDHGWQLGEHGEWCKHTNFELATRAPMMIKVPGVTDVRARARAGTRVGPLRTSAFTEHVDLFSTLSELAMGVSVPQCPAGPTQLTTALCTMGKSLVPLLNRQLAAAAATVATTLATSNSSAALLSTNDDVDVSYNASYMQYPREAQMMQRSTCLDKPCVMGYSIVTRIQSRNTADAGAGAAARIAREYRYTEWVAFNTKSHRAPDFESSVGAELYDHTADVGENTNLCGPAAVCNPADGLRATVDLLRQALRQGPLTGGGWGPWATTQ